MKMTKKITITLKESYIDDKLMLIPKIAHRKSWIIMMPEF